MIQNSKPQQCLSLVTKPFHSAEHSQNVDEQTDEDGP